MSMGAVVFAAVAAIMSGIYQKFNIKTAGKFQEIINHILAFERTNLDYNQRLEMLEINTNNILRYIPNINEYLSENQKTVYDFVGIVDKAIILTNKMIEGCEEVEKFSTVSEFFKEPSISSSISI